MRNSPQPEGEGSAVGSAPLAPAHVDLLRAALLPRAEAAAALERWCSATDLDHADEGSRRILPLLYRNLGRVGLEHPDMGRLRGLYRRCWYRNQVLLASLFPVLQRLREAGIATLVLKGAALVVRYYHDIGAREMADADMAVPIAHLQEAVTILRGLGWEPVKPPRGGFDGALVGVTHAWTFRDAAARELDLHWFITRETGLAGLDDMLWGRAVPLSIAGAPTLALDDTDMLLHLLIHGMRWNPVAPLRWVADATTVVGSGSCVDWERLAVDAQRIRLVLKVREALECLRDVAGVPIPETVLALLRTFPVSRFERREHRSQMREPGILGGLPVYWYRHRRGRRGPERSRCPSFLYGLACYWGTEGKGQFAAAVLRRGLRRIRRHVFGSAPA